MLRLVWYTKATAGLDLGERMPGAINQDGLEPTDPWEDVILDVGVAAESAIAPSGPRQEEFFELTLPDGPYSFLSDAFSIHWTVELEVNGGEVAERLDIVVSPWGTVVDARRKAEESEEALGTA